MNIIRYFITIDDKKAEFIWKRITEKKVNCFNNVSQLVLISKF